MNYLTNYYKNRCDQLQEQVSILSSQIKLLNEEGDMQQDAQEAPVPGRGWGDDVQHGQRPIYPEGQDDSWYGNPNFNPNDPLNPPTYDEWARRNPRPVDRGDGQWYREVQEWERRRDQAWQYYERQRQEALKRKYYEDRQSGFFRGIHDLTREVMPDIFNPFGN